MFLMKNHLTEMLPLLMLVFLFQATLYAYQIKGNIILTDDWEMKIYLSAIPSFDDMRTASEDLIVQVAAVGTDGSFVLQGEDLPLGDRLYRLHVCKKGDPAATLFIGGKEENHLHFIMNNGLNLFFRSNCLFQNARMEGYEANISLNQFAQELSRLRRPPKPNSHINRQNRQQHLASFLLDFVDTCSNAVVGQLALSHLDLLELCGERPDFVRMKMEEWKTVDVGSPYLATIQQQVEVILAKRVNSPSRMWLLVGLGITSLLFGYLFFNRKKGMPKSPPIDQADLSLQERRVYQMLSKGKSNKEISEELHIEVSTVKSHVSSIYAKLGVRSRKELITP